MKKVLKWLTIGTLLLVVLAVIAFLSLDTLVRLTIERRIQRETGMVADIGKFDFSFSEPVVSIKDLKLHNPASFGGAPFLDISEIHVEYDPVALQNKRIHLTLVRLNLSELDIVKNEAGQTNLFALGVEIPKQGQGRSASESAALKEFKQRTGLTFQGIDTLDVSVGTVKFIDLANPKNNREQRIGVENCRLSKTKDKQYGVETYEDLTGLAVLIALRGGDFFTDVFGDGIRLK